MPQRDYYDVLEVTGDADSGQIRDAYRRLALLHHPDRNRDNPEATERMKEINEAYAVLSDPEKRKEYDLIRQTYGSAASGRFRQTHSDQDIFRGSDIRQVFEELSRAFGYRSFEDIFRESYGAGYRTFEFRQPGAFGRIFVGGFGAGGAAGKPAQPAGWLEKLIRYGLKKKWGIELPERGKDTNDILTLSPEQAKTGGKVRYADKRTGRELSVTVPPAAKAGMKLRLKGMGEAGRGGGEAGDLYLTLAFQSPLLWKAKNVIAAIHKAVR